jgi:hypothetical protein
MTTLYQIAKILHIYGFITAIGVSAATYFAYNRFWKLYGTNKEQGIAAFKAFTYLQTIGLLGLVFVLLAGFTMLFLIDWAFVSVLWFQIKLGLVVLIFVNGFTLGRTSTLRLQAFISGSTTDARSTVVKDKLKIRLQTFLLLQLLIYATIIVLSVFRFV